MKTIKLPTKSFDFGIYTFKRHFSGPDLPRDDQEQRDGTVFAVLHPMTKVDPEGRFCFAVSGSDLYTKTLVRKNLRLNRVATLQIPVGGIEVHEKLNAVVDYLRARTGQQATLPGSEGQGG